MKEKRIFAFALCIVLSLSLSSCTVSDYVNNLDALETHATTKKSPVPLLHAADCVTLLLPLWRKVQVHARIRDED